MATQHLSPYQQLYTDWLKASMQLKEAKDKELSLRKLICDQILIGKLEGAKTSEIEGFKITATAKLNRKIDNEVLQTLWEDLTDDEKECFEYKPSLKVTNFRKFEESDSKLLEAITISPATPTLKISRIKEE